MWSATVVAKMHGIFVMEVIFGTDGQCAEQTSKNGDTANICLKEDMPFDSSHALTVNLLPMQGGQPDLLS